VIDIVERLRRGSGPRFYTATCDEAVQVIARHEEAT